MRAVLATLLLAVMFVATAPAKTYHRHHQQHAQHHRPLVHQKLAHHQPQKVARHRPGLVAQHQPHHRVHDKTALAASSAGRSPAATSHFFRPRVAQQVRWFGPDTRPAKWCGWFMRQIFGVTDRAYNRAAEWTKWGHWSPGPRVGAVVVWWHHVGLIEGGPDGRGQWLVKSGNDAHAVRTRFMSLARAIAFRMP